VYTGVDAEVSLPHGLKCLVGYATHAHHVRIVRLYHFLDALQGTITGYHFLLFALLSRGSSRHFARCLGYMYVLELVYCLPAGSLKLRCDNGSRLHLGFSCVARDQKRESNDPASRLALSVRRFSIRDSRLARSFARECRLQSAEGPTGVCLPWRQRTSPAFQGRYQQAERDLS